ncbi:MAG: hypothetical protein Q8T11_14265 [Elusimicrobiota bacterium]|nr:hypothetical protein [Elusimicrobiota bacterium]
MTWKNPLAGSRRILPVLLFLLGCFPSRGLYFLVNNDASPGGLVRTHQPALRAPVNPRPKLNQDLPPLPKRLSRVPRALQESPSIPAWTDGEPLTVTPPRSFTRLALFGAEGPPSRRTAVVEPPGRAPPPAVS